MLRCVNSANCHFFQECEFHPTGSTPCLGFCVMSEWFVKVIWITCIGTIGALVACIRCEHCPIHQWLMWGKCCEKRRQIEAGRVAKTSLPIKNNQQQDRIATFQDVVLVRSFSQGRG